MGERLLDASEGGGVVLGLQDLPGALQVGGRLLELAERLPEEPVLEVHLALEPEGGLRPPAQLERLLEEHEAVLVPLSPVNLSHDEVEPGERRREMVGDRELLRAADLVLRLREAARVEVEPDELEPDRHLE